MTWYNCHEKKEKGKREKGKEKREKGKGKREKGKGKISNHLPALLDSREESREPPCAHALPLCEVQCIRTDHEHGAWLRVRGGTVQWRVPCELRVH